MEQLIPFKIQPWWGGDHFSNPQRKHDDNPLPRISKTNLFGETFLYSIRNKDTIKCAKTENYFVLLLSRQDM